MFRKNNTVCQINVDSKKKYVYGEIMQFNIKPSILAYNLPHISIYYFAKIRTIRDN